MDCSDCNITIILGNDTLEDDAKVPKLLLLCPCGVLYNRLVTKSQKDDFAKVVLIILLLAEKDLESGKHVAPQPKFVMRQTRICCNS